MKSPESLYIHIPFCKSKCPYCDFASWANKEGFMDKYFDALVREIQTKCEAYYNYRNKNFEPSELQNIRTIFIGGGTPSLVPPKYYKKVFNELKRFFTISSNCEITLELNPGTANIDYLKSYKSIGINRISIGAQSFNEKTLIKLGRKHSIKDTLEAIQFVKDAGFTNFSLDLIYGVPDMDMSSWTHSLQQALEFKPKHISAYSLIIEPDTPFEVIYKNPNLLPRDDLVYEMYNTMCTMLQNAGFEHYEISNFALPTYQSRHNLAYWRQKEYFAFGNSAHRFIGGLRTSNLRSLEEYINYPNTEKITEFPINYDFEELMLNSRLNQGFDMNLLFKATQKNTLEVKQMIQDMATNGLIKMSGNKVSFTDKGMFVNSEILLKLM